THQSTPSFSFHEPCVQRCACVGHAAAPPSSVMNSRRLMGSLRRRDRTLSDRRREWRVVRHGKFAGQCVSWVMLNAAAEAIPINSDAPHKTTSLHAFV